MKRLIIFDLDGTLYNFNSCNDVNFNSSAIYTTIKNKAYAFLAKKLNVSREQAQAIYEQVKKEFRGEVSLGLEKKYKIDRYEWFEASWDIEPADFIEQKNLKPLMDSLNSEIAILTAAPKVWALKVLQYFNLSEYNSKLFTGEPDIRKPNPEVFKLVCEQIGIAPERTISVGDQVFSDILPAKSLGMKTVLIRGNSEEADYCINSLDELPKIIERFAKLS